MISDVGKTAASIKKNGYVYHFFNRSCINFNSEITFYDINDKKKYKIQADQQAANKHYRCCYYSLSAGYTPVDGLPRLVLFIPDSVVVAQAGTAVPVKPLYEFISPYAYSNSNGDYRLSWWSNTDDLSSMQQQINGNILYKYDFSKIKKFSNVDLGNEKSTASSTKILCSADIIWRYLRQDGGGVTSKDTYPTPIIFNPVIVYAIKGQGYITDFSTGGGGGLSIHSHISNDDGGFAAATFMPSAAMRPINWK